MTPENIDRESVIHVLGNENEGVRDNIPGSKQAIDLGTTEVSLSISVPNSSIAILSDKDWYL
jgi:hypothetical protein